MYKIVVAWDFVISIIKILKDKLYSYTWNVLIKYIHPINSYTSPCIPAFTSITYLETDHDVAFNYTLPLVKYIFF